MLRLQLLVCIAAFALATGTAQANPYSRQVLRTRALPGPHVQITYGVDGSSLPVETPSLAATFGTKQTPWVTGGYTTNTGSGLVWLSAVQICDCYVPKGRPLTYSTAVANLNYIGTITLSSTITVSDFFDAAPPLDSSPGDAGVLPWNIPDPVGVQGVDCTKVCQEFTPDASIVASDVPLASPDALIAVADASIATPDVLLSSADALIAAADVPIVTPDAPIAASDALTTTADASVITLDAPTIAPDASVAVVDTPLVTVDAPPTTADASTATPDARIAALDASVAPADAPIAVAPDARTTTAGGSKGCSYGGTGHLSGLSLAAVLALLFFRRRRGS